MYFHGLGVEQDYAKARPWFERALALDHYQAADALAGLFWNGQGGCASSLQRAREVSRALVLCGPSRLKPLPLNQLYQRAEDLKRWDGPALLRAGGGASALKSLSAFMSKVVASLEGNTLPAELPPGAPSLFS